MRSLILLSALLYACPEPPPATSGSVGGPPAGAGAQAPQGTGTPGPPGPPAGEGAGGAPPADGAAGAQGAPDQAGTEPGPGTPPEPGKLPTFVVTEGQAVTVSGTVTYSGTAQGTLRLDVLQGAEGDQAGSVLHAMVLDEVGAFSLQAPKATGKVTVSAFIDADGNGPSASEPQGRIDVTIADANVTGVTVEMK